MPDRPFNTTAGPTRPERHRHERPAEYAHRLGRAYLAARSLTERRRSAQFFTSVAVADFMAANVVPIESEFVSVLDPGAGSGILACALGEALAYRDGLKSISLTAVELDPTLAILLCDVLTELAGWLSERGVSLSFEVRSEDFVIAAAGAFSAASETHNPGYQLFDIVISNPPYFKLSKDDPRVEHATDVVHGQPNIYSLFMSSAARLLSKRGQLIFITPRSYCSGRYFERFRRWFFQKVDVTGLHLFTSRTQVFKTHEVLQENVILWAASREAAAIERPPVRVSWSDGVSDLSRSPARYVPSTAVLKADDPTHSIWIPLTVEDDESVRRVRAWSSSLDEQGLRISTGPVIAFRTRPYLDYRGDVPTSHAPLLWLKHVRAMSATWPLERHRREQYVRVRGAHKRLIPDGNYVVLRRFSAKEEPRRLVAAPLLRGSFGSPLLGIENHLNYIHRPSGSLGDAETWGLAALYNSELMDKYFRVVSGNTQVSATELRSTPLPPTAALSRLGDVARESGGNLSSIDAFVHAEL